MKSLGVENHYTCKIIFRSLMGVDGGGELSSVAAGL